MRMRERDDSGGDVAWIYEYILDVLYGKACSYFATLVKLRAILKCIINFNRIKKL